LPVVQENLEQRGERGLQVRDVCRVELHRVLGQQSVVGRHGVLVTLFELGVTRDQRQHVLAMGGRMLRLLPQEGLGLGGDVRIAIEPVLGLAQRGNDVLLERHRDECESVAKDSEVRVRGLPTERDVGVEFPRDLSDHQIRHRRAPSFRRARPRTRTAPV
jgi:hypothetical protein